MKKLEIDDRVDHKRNSVISGFGPHKILEMKIREAFEKDVFDIDRIKWKELSYQSMMR